MRRFNRIQALALSLFSPDLYRDIAAHWRGVGFLYLLLLLTLTWIPVDIKLHIGLRHFAKNDFPRISKDFPPITIAKGEASSPVPQPYYINDPDSGKPFFILDTTGQITAPPPGNDPVILLTKTDLIIRDQRQTKITPLSQMPDMFVDSAKLQRVMDWFAGTFSYFFFPAALLISFIYRMFTTLIYALVGLIFNAVFNKNLSFGALMRLAAVATTPIIYINTVLWMTGKEIPLWFLVGFAITCVYVAFAVKWAEPRTPNYPQYGQPYPPGPYAAPPGPYAPPPPGYYNPPPQQPPPRV